MKAEMEMISKTITRSINSPFHLGRQFIVLDTKNVILNIILEFQIYRLYRPCVFVLTVLLVPPPWPCARSKQCQNNQSWLLIRFHCFMLSCPGHIGAWNPDKKRLVYYIWNISSQNVYLTPVLCFHHCRRYLVNILWFKTSTEKLVTVRYHIWKT